MVVAANIERIRIHNTAFHVCASMLVLQGKFVLR